MSARHIGQGLNLGGHGRSLSPPVGFPVHLSPRLEISEQAGKLRSNKFVLLRARNVAELLRSTPSEVLRAYRVTTAINSVKNDGPECTETIE